MFRFLCKYKSLTQIKIAENSQTHLFVALPKSQSFCSPSVSTCSNSSSSITSSTEQQSSSSAGDLINSRGLSRQNPYNSSDSVLSVFESYGFSQTQIKTIVSKYPRLLILNPESILKPKIDFFRSVGIPEADVANMITRDPYILGRSLKDRLIPTFDLLTTLLGGEHNAVCTIKRVPSIFSRNVPKYLEPNLSTLRNQGVPESRISKMMSQWEMIRAIADTPNDWFSKAVDAVMRMGFDPCSSSFARAVAVMALHEESNWERKLGLYRSLGFSDKESISMFRKQPTTMQMSEKNISETVEFFFNKFHWSPSQLSDRPNVLMYSLEKRSIPRCSVLQLLASRDRAYRSVSVLWILSMKEEDFVRRYVNKYKDEVPEVLDAKQGKLKFNEYNFDLGEPRG